LALDPLRLYLRVICIAIERGAYVPAAHKDTTTLIEDSTAKAGGTCVNVDQVGISLRSITAEFADEIQQGSYASDAICSPAGFGIARRTGKKYGTRSGCLSQQPLRNWAVFSHWAENGAILASERGAPALHSRLNQFTWGCTNIERPT
jgi:hypothetical protein